jgi:hypothetical protein
MCIAAYINFQRDKYMATNLITPPQIIIGNNKDNIEQIIYQLKKFRETNESKINSDINKILLNVSPSKDGRDIKVAAIEENSKKAEFNANEATKFIENYLTEEINKSVKKNSQLDIASIERTIKILEYSLTDKKISGYEKVLLMLKKIEYETTLKGAKQTIEDSKKIEIHSRSTVRLNNYRLIVLMILIGFLPITIWIFINYKK